MTIGFVGPLALAAVDRRRPRDLAWVGLAALGVVMFGAGPTKVDAVGFGVALLAGACWALYIVSAATTGRHWAGTDGLAVASTMATPAIAPFAVATAGSRLLDPRVLVLAALVGLLSSVIPYSLEMAALRTLPPRVLGILMSLEPATAALVAVLLLREWLTPLQLLAMACVIAASVGAARDARRGEQVEGVTAGGQPRWADLLTRGLTTAYVGEPAACLPGPVSPGRRFRGRSGYSGAVVGPGREPWCRRSRTVGRRR